MKVLIAGGAGYIGSVLVPQLLELGHDVTVVDLMWFGNHLPEATTIIEKDAFSITEQELEGFEQIIFLAGLSNDPQAEYSLTRNFIENGAMPAYLAFVGKRAGVRRFIYASSCSVYGFTSDELFDEESSANCSYPYGISKLQGERAALQLADSGFSVIALRQGTVCGYSPRMRFDLIVNTMFKCARQDQKITVNNPNIWRPILDVRDTARAFVNALEVDSEVSGVFNVAYDNFTVGDIGRMVHAQVSALTNVDIELVIDDVDDMRNYRVTTQKARDVLSFQPKHSIEDIVSKLHEHVEEYGDFSDSAFYNIQVFTKLDRENDQY